VFYYFNIDFAAEQISSENLFSFFPGLVNCMGVCAVDHRTQILSNVCHIDSITGVDPGVHRGHVPHPHP